MKAISHHRFRQMNLCEITPHPDNPRVHSKEQIGQIVKSIKTFGFKLPILVDRNHRIIAGHG